MPRAMNRFKKETAIAIAILCIHFVPALADPGQANTPSVETTRITIGGVVVDERILHDKVIKFDRSSAPHQSSAWWDQLFKLFQITPGSAANETLPFRRSIALLVGIGNYRYLEPRLEYVSRDIQKMRDYLLTDGGFDSVYVMDESVSPELVQRYMMEGFPEKLEKDDRLLFYYSGHAGDPGGGHPYLLFQDFQPDQWSQNVLRVDDFQIWSDVIPAKHVLFIYDACLAGLALPKSGSEDLRSSVAQVSGSGSRTVVTAGTADQKAWILQASFDNQSSIFTDALLKGLRNGVADKGNRGFVTIEQAVAYAHVELAMFTARLGPGYEMKPEARPINPDRFRGSFVFLNSLARSPTLSTEDERRFHISQSVPTTEPTKCHDGPEDIAPAARNPIDELRYVLIPAGRFKMGCVATDSKCRRNESPQHTVTITKSSYVGRTEVTVAAYRRYAVARGESMPVEPFFNTGWTDPDQPVVNITWTQANNFCRWAGGGTGSLPNEAEWERAARGGDDDLIYPWGMPISAQNANYGRTPKESAPVAAVCQFPPNKLGLYDVSGNVAEWTNDSYDENYYTPTPSSDPQDVPRSTSTAVVRGGSWEDEPRNLRLSSRSYRGRAEYDEHIGFRCELDAIPQKEQ